VTPDPSAYPWRISRHHCARRFAGMKSPTVLVDDYWCVKTQDSPRRNADPAPGNRAQHQGASRKARPVDDDPLTRLPHPRKERQIAANCASKARHNPDISQGWRRADNRQDGHENETPHCNPSPNARLRLCLSVVCLAGQDVAQKLVPSKKPAYPGALPRRSFFLSEQEPDC
jgi:hypothetical protein